MLRLSEKDHWPGPLVLSSWPCVGSTGHMVNTLDRAHGLHHLVGRNDFSACKTAGSIAFPGSVEAAVSSSRPDTSRVVRRAAVKEARRAPPQAA
jgi:hypothetical protein